MRLLKRILIGFVVVLVVLVGLFLVFVGPWPAYTSGYEGTGYYNGALAAIENNIKESKITDTPGRLQAGWGVALMTPPIGTPMAGYGERNNPFGEDNVSTGVQDDLFVKALAFSDGDDTAVIVGSDMLLVPPNVADLVRARIGQETPLTPNDLYFTASHTHDGPGAWGPGLAAHVTGGKYDPKIVQFLADAFSQAILDAYKSLEPAKMAHGGTDGSAYIRNRAREASVDSELSYLIVEKDSGKRCYLVSFSAHPTIVDGDTTLLTPEYPGALQRAIERDTGGTAVYLGGSLGSSGNKAPEGPDAYARVNAMGDQLASLLLADIQSKQQQWETNVDVVSLGIAFDAPPLQVRIGSPKWRASPLLGPIAGLQKDAWMSALRLNGVVFVGLPADFSGEISLLWKTNAQAQGIDLWTTSFCGAYLGYISPDKYYNDTKAYETGMMSWTGPHQEAFFTALKDKMLDVLGKPAPPASQAVTTAPAPAPAVAAPAATTANVAPQS